MEPRPDLPKRLPLAKVQAGTRWFRVHASTSNTLWFGPAAGSPPIHRFDDPAGRFGVCYFGASIEVAFAETFLRNPPVRILDLADLATRSISTIELRRELRLLTLDGPGLARLGATAELASTSGYARSQAWAGAFWEHAEKPDGLIYRSRHDDSALCVAAYDRARDGLAVVEERTLTDDAKLLARLLKRYDLGLTR
jgi:hypothetical protein